MAKRKTRIRKFYSTPPLKKLNFDDFEYRWKGLFPTKGHFIEKWVKISRLIGRRNEFLVRPITKKTIESNRKKMKSLGTSYRKEYADLD